MLDVRLAVTDTPVGLQPEMVRCRAHGDTGRPNMAVYSDGIYCFRCHFTRKGEEAVRWLVGEDADIHHYTVEAVEAYRERVEAEARDLPLPAAYAALYQGVLATQRKARREWLYQRGLTDSGIALGRLGHTGVSFTIPVLDDKGDILTIRYRQDPAYQLREGGPKYWGFKGRNATYLYPEWLLVEDLPEEVVVVESELDALLLWQQGIPAASPTNGAGQMRKVPQMLRTLGLPTQRLLVAGDMDEAGRAATIETVTAAEGIGMRAKPFEFTPGKDITEWLAAGGQRGTLTGEWDTGNFAA